MSSVAILSDIHGNLPALEAVLAEVRASGEEDIVFLGDIVGYGASPAECVELVRKHGGRCVMGNHDAEIHRVRRRGGTFRDPEWKKCGYQAGLAHAARCLDADQAGWLANLPYRFAIPGAVAAHASLNEPEAFHYIEDGESARSTLAILKKERTKVGFFGHTHVCKIFADDAENLEWLDETRVKIVSGGSCVVTVGSVGQPRHPTERRATWVLWNPSKHVIEFRATEYDRYRAVRDIIAAGLPLESALKLLTADELGHFAS